MGYVEIFLEKHTRGRQYHTYEKDLHLPENLFDGDMDILVIGGGEGVYDFPYKLQTANRITNIDLFVPPAACDHSINSIQGDFMSAEFRPDSFDEIWALWSLPLYCPTSEAARIFFAKGCLFLKPGGKFRILPITLRDESAGLMRGAIKRNVHSSGIFRNLYHCMHQFVKIGGKIDIRQCADLAGGTTESSQVFDAALFRKFMDVKFTDEIPIGLTSAIITKPENSSAAINQKLQEDISHLNKTAVYPGIIAHIDNQKIRY